MIFNCQTCKKPFGTDKKSRRFCSPDCSHASTRRFTPDALKKMAFTGANLGDISKAFRVSPPTIHRALFRYGLYQMWREQRYA